MSGSDPSSDPIRLAIARDFESRRRAETERVRLENLIERHRASIERLPRHNTGTALKTVGAIVTERTGLQVEISGPFGINSEYGFSVLERDGVTGAYLMFRPVGGDGGIEMIDLESDDERYAPNSLGRMNGSHRIGLPVPTLDELLAMVDKQRSEHRLRRAISKDA